MIKSNPGTEEVDEIDSPETKRKWFTHTRNGERGWLVERNEKPFIKLDRPMRETLLPFKKGEWKPMGEYRPLTGWQVAQVAFEADKQLCFFLGKHQRAKLEWISLSDEERLKWVKNGPPGVDRKMLFDANMESMRHLKRGS